MNKTVIALSLLTSMWFASCSNAKPTTTDAVKSETTDTAKTETKNTANLSYRCPMDCEHGKVYNEQGKCPVCEMDLEEVK